jgi:type IV secretory pathway VirB10-like protein
MPASKQASRPVRKTAVAPKVQPRPKAAPAVPQPAVAAPAKSSKPAAPPKAPKAAKPAKPPKQRSKPVRDSFTMPPADFALIASLKARTGTAGRETKKSELLRAGLHALEALNTPALLAALGALAPVKVGRPKSGR